MFDVLTCLDPEGVVEGTVGIRELIWFVEQSQATKLKLTNKDGSPRRRRRRRSPKKGKGGASEGFIEGVEGVGPNTIMGTTTPNAKGRAGARAAKTRRHHLPIDEAVAKKLQSKLKAACYGTTPQKMFARWDDDGQGVLDVEEFRHLLRAGLKINKLEVPDSHVDMLITALDDDASGTVSIDELADFVDRGTATFFSGPVTPAAMETAPIHQRQPSRDFNKAAVSKLQSRLKAALYGTDALAFFSRYDRDGLGTVDGEPVDHTTTPPYYHTTTRYHHHKLPTYLPTWPPQRPASRA